MGEQSMSSYIPLIIGLVGAIIGAAASVITILIQSHYGFQETVTSMTLLVTRMTHYMTGMTWYPLHILLSLDNNILLMRKEP